MYSVETVGDGRVLARAFTDTGTIIMISENGTDWTQAAVPHGISPDFIDVSGDRWLIAGHDATGFGPAEPSIPTAKVKTGPSRTRVLETNPQ